MSIQYPVRQRAAGNTMTEYLFIAFLILVVSVGTWMTIGKGLNGMATRLKTEFKERGDLAAAKRTALSSMQTGPTGLNLNGQGAPTLGPLLNCDFTKMTCTTPPPPAFTSGGNGNDMQAFIINMLTNLLRSIGIDVQPDPDAVLTRMAQTGHKIAFLQKVMEALQNYTAEDVERLKDTTIQIEGESYKVQELVNMLNDLTAQVEADQTSVENSNLPPETIAETTESSSTIVSSGQETSTEVQNTLNTPPPPVDPVTGLPVQPSPTVDPTTGLPTTPVVDPTTGLPTTTPTVDPNTGLPTTPVVDPTTGLPTTTPTVDPTTGLPTTTTPTTGETGSSTTGSGSGSSTGSRPNSRPGSSNRPGRGNTEDTSGADVTEDAATNICQETSDPSKCTPMTSQSTTPTSPQFTPQ